MPPEDPGNLTVIDLRFEDGTLKSQFERVDAPLKDWLKVSWSAETPPPLYLPVGNGVVYFKDEYDLQAVKASGNVDDLGELRYGWRQKEYGQGLMLVLILPSGYTLAGASVPPEAAKPFDADSRIALYWMLTSESGRVALDWTLAGSEADVRKEAARLNASFYGGGRRAAPAYTFIAEPEQPASENETRVRVFCSYGHEDRDYLEHLLDFMKDLRDEEGFDFWDDSMMRPGDDWDAVIKAEIDRADIALMLVS